MNNLTAMHNRSLKHVKVDKHTQRPYRLYDAMAKRPLPHYHYLHVQNAQLGALKLMHWIAIGASIEVINVHTGTLVAQYTRKVNTIWFFEAKIGHEKQSA